jgi:predicted  nucleic acid-binding Zn-ribbon protein
MSITIESDLKEILTRLEQKIDNVSKDVNDLKVSVAETKAELKGDIKALNEKVDGLSKRLDTTEFTNRGILIGLIVAILGGFAKLFGIVGNP